MIHLNVVFLVIRSTLNTIVKILIDASLLVVNKYTSNGLFRACVTTISEPEEGIWDWSGKILWSRPVARNLLGVL